MACGSVGCSCGVASLHTDRSKTSHLDVLGQFQKETDREERKKMAVKSSRSLPCGCGDALSRISEPM